MVLKYVLNIYSIIASPLGSSVVVRHGYETTGGSKHISNIVKGMYN